MAAAPAQPNPRPHDPVVDRYIFELRQRYRQFVRAQKLELRQIGLDIFTRIYHEYFALPNRSTFEVLLQAILEPDERDRLHIDPQFTQAWQIFVDLCWVHARAVRVGIVVTAVLFCLIIAGGILLAAPQLGGVAVLGILGVAVSVWVLSSLKGS